MQYAAGYAFGYQVRDHHTGNNFRHTQRQMKDGTTHGEYKILLPDGRTQCVEYKADDDGYSANVTYNIWMNQEIANNIKISIIYSNVGHSVFY